MKICRTPVRGRGGPARLSSLSLALALFVLVHQPAHAIEGLVRASIDAEGPVWVGERVIVNLDLLTTGFIFSDQRFHLPEIAGGLLVQTDTSTLKLTENFGGQTWQVLRYQLSLFPQRAGEFSVPAIPVSFAGSQGFGKPRTAFDLKTDAVRVAVQIPPGVSDAATLVTAPELEIETAWHPDPEQLRVGDALTVTIIRRAPDVSSMTFAPLPVPRIDGLSGYPKTPQMRDISNRGTLLGERIDTVTFVAQRPGSFELPGFAVTWWDPVREKLTERRVDGVHLEVAPNPALATLVSVEEAVGATVREYPLLAAALLALVVALIAAVWGFRRRLIDLVHAWRERRAESEAAYFGVLQKACRSGNPANAYNALIDWLTRSSVVPRPVMLSTFAAVSAESDLTSELAAMEAAILTPGAEWSGGPLAAALRRARKAMIARRRVHSAAALPPLNPLSQRLQN